MSEMVEVLELEEEDTMKGKFLTFSLGKEDYGIEIKHVTEIIGIQTITEVPDLPSYVRGIINLRGRIIPVMDVRLRFNKESREYDDRTCIIIIDVLDFSVGLIVDQVSEVLSIPEDEIVAPPNMDKSSHNRYIKGIGKIDNQVKLILDCEELINSSEMERLSDIA